MAKFGRCLLNYYYSPSFGSPRLFIAAPEPFSSLPTAETHTHTKLLISLARRILEALVVGFVHLLGRVSAAEAQGLV